jgi:hypothetical protein
MGDGTYDDLIGHRPEIDRVREASQERAAYLTWARVRERCLQDARKRPVGLRGKGVAKPRTLIVVPVTGVQ